MQRRAFLKNLCIGASFGLALNRLDAIAANDAKPAGKSHRVLTCNIRVALPQDEETGNGWSTRRSICIDVIRAHRPDLVCLQEVLRVQMRDLEKAFPEFGSFGFPGPEIDGVGEEYRGVAKNPILYSRERYELVSAGGFWLSETPHLPGSSSWGSARARHINWLRLRDRKGEREFRIMSLHLDHKSQPAREQQIKLVLDEAALYPEDFPQILAGDFNARATNPVMEMALATGWKNSQTELPEPRDNGFTVHGFLGAKHASKTGSQPPGPIDFILTRGKVATQSWKIIRDERNGRYPSDHYFLAADLALSQ